MTPSNKDPPPAPASNADGSRYVRLMSTIIKGGHLECSMTIFFRRC